MQSNRKKLGRIVDKLERAIVEAGSDPWEDVQQKITLLLPALTDAGLLWENTGASSDGVMTDAGESLGGFWLIDLTNGHNLQLDNVTDVQDVWLARLRQHLRDARVSQLRHYGAWVNAVAVR